MASTARMATRERVLQELKTRGPQTASELARWLEVTPMAVRQHLYHLEQQGLVDFVEERRKVGRPARKWRLHDKASGRFPNAHGQLTVGLINAARSVFGEEGLQRLADEHTRRTAQAYRRRMPVKDGPLEQRVRALVGVLREDGYMPDCHVSPDGSIELVENHCPVFEAACCFDGLCVSELTLFRELLGDDVAVERSEHILDGQRRCVYRLRPL